MLTETQIKLLTLIVENVDFAGRPPMGSIYGPGREAWAIATNGQYLLGFEVASLEGIKPLTSAKIAQKIAPWLDYAEGLEPVSFPALLAWCKKAGYLKCPCCDGSGERNIDLGKKFIEGVWIDGFGNIDGGSFGMLSGLPISRNLMVRTLAYLPTQERVLVGQIPAALSNKTKQPLLLIQGDGWRYVQCPLSCTPEECEAMDRFEDRREGFGPDDHGLSAMDLGVEEAAR